MNKITNIIIVLFFWGFGCPHCFSQSPINFENFSTSTVTPDDGLSQGSNYFRYEDSKGFMWLTGNDAVNRFDGSMVKVYNLDKYFTNCPNLQQGYGFAEDDSSNIYVGSVRGLYKYKRTTDKFSLIKIFSNAGEAIAMPFGYKQGKVWCFNKQWQLASYDVVTGKVEYFNNMQTTAIPSIHIYDMESNILYYRWPFFDNAGNIWLINENELLCYNPVTRETTYPQQKYFNDPDNEIYAASYNTSNNSLYLGTRNGLTIINASSFKLVSKQKIGENKLGVINNIVAHKNFIAFANRLNLYITDTAFQKIVLVNKTAKQYYRINSFGMDKSSRLWVCDDGLGQLIFNFNPPLLAKEPQQSSIANTLEKTGVANFAQFANGDMLIRNNLIQHYKTKELSDFQMPNVDASNFYRTTTDTIRKGIWFFSTNDLTKYSVYFLDEKKNIKFYNILLSQTGIIQDLQVLPDGKVICATAKGLYWINTVSKQLDSIAKQPYLNCFKINVLNNQLLAISYLNNPMWLATIQHDGKVNFVQKILPGIQSFYITEDKPRKKYWVGTNQGVFLLNEKMETVKRFNSNNGLAGTYIYGLLLDADGNAWCSHQRGLSSINTSSFQIINYTKKDGIQDWDFNNRTYFKAMDGTLYFGGTKGFNYFKPPLLEKVFYRPEVYVDEILVNNSVYLPDSNAGFIDNLQLAFNQNNISVHAVVKDLENGREQQIWYRLNNTPWNHISNNGVINFNNLAPGNYKLELAVYDKFANSVKAQKTIEIKIDNPFYKTIWFWVLGSVLITGLLVWLYNRNRLLKQQRKYNQQIALDNQRLKITADLHDDIGASLSSLQVNSAVAGHLLNTNLSQAKEVLKKIEAQSRHLSENIGDIIWSMKPGKGEFMTMSSRIKTFVTDMLGATNIEYNIHIDKEADTLIKDFTARKNVVLIIKEALNNAVKYSGASKIDIGLYIKNKKVAIYVEDNGKGMEAENKPGNGLDNMKKRTEELNGHFEIISVMEKGTKITTSFPVP